MKIRPRETISLTFGCWTGRFLQLVATEAAGHSLALDTYDDERGLLVLRQGHRAVRDTELVRLPNVLGRAR